MEKHEAYAVSFAVLSVLLALGASWVVFVNRNESRMKVRYPLVLWLELFFSALHSANVALWYVGYFAPDSCQPAAAVIEGTEWFIASFFVGRMCLVYMQAKTNNLLKDVSKYSDWIVEALALVTAPGYFYKIKQAHSIIENQVHDAIEKNEVKTLDEKGIAKLQSMNRLFTGELRYLLCAFLWGAYGFISSYIYTTSVPSDPALVQAMNTIDCWLEYIRFQTAILFLVVGLIAAFFVAVFYQVIDLVGTRNEFVIAFSIVSIVKIFNGLNIAILFFVESFWGDLISVFLYPFIVTLITTIYVYRWDALIDSFFSRRSRNTKSDFSSDGIKTWKDVQNLWTSSEEGRNLIIKVSGQLYMGETVKFLEATDGLTEETLHDSTFRNIFNAYIKIDARYQLNISHKLRTQWEKVAKAGGSEWTLIVATRTEMFVLIWPGFVRHTSTILAHSTEALNPSRKSKSRRSSDRDREKTISKKKAMHKRTHSGPADSESGPTKSSTDPSSPAPVEGPRKLADVVAEQVA